MNGTHGLENVPCNLCGQNSAAQFLSIKGRAICKCPSCGLIYVNPRPTAGDLCGIYDASYFANRDNCFTSHYFGYYGYEENENEIKDSFRPRLKTIERLLGNKGRLLDIGCAMGFFLSVAREEGWQVYGTDVSEAAVKRAGQDHGGSVFCGTVDQAPLEPASFDAITMWDVVEHLPDPASTLRLVNRLLKKGGIFALVTPDAGSLPAMLLRSRWPEFRRVEEHIYFFSRKTLAAMLKKNGFEIVMAEGAGRIFTLPGLLSEMKIYNYTIFSGLSRLCSALGLSRVKIYVKPGYKFAMYARKTSEA